MKSLHHAGLLLSPLIVHWEAAHLGQPLAGAIGGTLAAAALAAWTHRRREDLLLPAGLLSIQGLAVVLLSLDGGAQVREVSAAAALAAALLMLLGAAIGRPWTAVISARDWQGMTADPVFRRANRGLSLLWAAVVAWIGTATAIGFDPPARWSALAVAIGLSMWLPRRWVHAALQARIARTDPHPWPSPLRVVRRKTDDADVLVVGAGIGGLTAAALLARTGARIHVYEQHDKPGGFCHHWEGRAGTPDHALVFRFDAGVHDVCGVHAGGTVHALLQRLGLGHAIDWRPLAHCFVDARGAWRVPRGWDAFSAALAQRHPADAPALRTALDLLERIHRAMFATAGQRGGVPGPPDSVSALLAFARENPQAAHWLDATMVDLLSTHGVGASAQADLLGLSGYLTHRPRELRVRQYAPLLGGYFMHGGAYPAGGSGRLAQALVDSIELDGGRVHLGCPVAEVLLASAPGRAVRGLRLADGRELRATAVVLNAEPLGAGRALFAPDVLPPAWAGRLRTLQPSASMLAVHLGIRGELHGLAPVNHLHLDGTTVEAVLPSLVDPSSAPRGHHTLTLMRLLDPAAAREWFEQPALVDPRDQRRSAAYAARKAAFAEPMIDAAERLVPDLRERIVWRGEASPLTFRRYGWTSFGAVYGSIGAGSPLTRRSPVPGLVLAGAATHGPGIEAVMISGAEAADALSPGLLSAPG